jgi:hypothetical protein
LPPGDATASLGLLGGTAGDGRFINVWREHSSTRGNDGAGGGRRR